MPAAQHVGVADALALVVAGRDAEDIGTHAQVHILGDDGHRDRRLGAPQVQRRGEDAVADAALRAVLEAGRRLGVHRHPAEYAQPPAVVQGDALANGPAGAQAVDDVADRARVAPALVGVMFKAVDLLEDLEGDDDVTAGVVQQGLRIEEQDVRIEDVAARYHQHSGISARRAAAAHRRQ